MTESLYHRVEEMLSPHFLDVGELGLRVCEQMQRLPPNVQAHFIAETARIFCLGVEQGYKGNYQEDRANLLVDKNKLGTLRTLEDPLGEYFELVYLQGCVKKEL